MRQRRAVTWWWQRRRWKWSPQDGAGEEETGRAGGGGGDVGGGSSEHSQVSVLGFGDTEKFVRHQGRCRAVERTALTADRSMSISSSWPGLTGWDTVRSSQERAWTAGRKLWDEAWP